MARRASTKETNASHVAAPPARAAAAAKPSPTNDEAIPVSRREKQTLIPSFDPTAVAAQLERAAETSTVPPPFDPVSYARTVEEAAFDSSEEIDSSRTPQALIHPRDISLTPTPQSMTDSLAAAITGAASERETTGAIGRAMYGSYLSSDYPGAMTLAERVLEREPNHALAQLVLDACRARVEPASDAPRLLPSSVVRLKCAPSSLEGKHADHASQVVLGHVDGKSDIAMLAELSGISRPEALDRLHDLLRDGVLEVVNE